MTKFRIVPMLITLAITAAALFGGWFLYNSLAMKTPLQDTLEEMNGVEDVEVTLGGDNITIDLKLKEAIDLRQLIHDFKEERASVIGKRQLNWNIDAGKSKQLDQVWSNMLFPIAQAMENREYAALPELMKQVESANPQIQTDVMMDDEFVYIRLTDGAASKYEMLPRIPLTMGVWE